MAVTSNTTTPDASAPDTTAPDGATSDVDTSSSDGYRARVERLGAAQKSKNGPLYTVYVNRFFGRRLAAIADLLGMTPNQVTLASAACTFSAVAVLAVAPNTIVLVAVVTGLLLLGFALDAADGQLARLRGGGSRAGEWLDHMVDAVKVTAIHGAVLVHLYRSTDVAEGWLLLPIAFATVHGGRYFAQILSEQLGRSEPTTRQSVQMADSPVKRIAGLWVDYGVMCWMFATLVDPDLFVIVYAAFLLANALHFVLACRHRFSELRATDAGASR